MRKYLFSAVALFALLATPVFTASCGGDDDDDNGGIGKGDTPAPVLTKADGTKVYIQSFGYYSFEYDDNGKLIGLTDGNASTTYEDGVYVGSTSTWGNSTEVTKVSISLNSKGLISKITTNVTDTDDDGHISWEESWTANYSYNGQNECTGYSGSSKGSWDDLEFNDKGSGSVTASANVTWQDGNLVKCVYKSNSQESGTEYGERYNSKWSDENTYTYEYGTTVNPLRQMPSVFADMLDFADYEGVAPWGILGLYGVGPKNLPTYKKTVATEIEDGERESFEDESQIFIKLNSDGTFASENGTSYSYVPNIFQALSTARVAQQVYQVVQTSKGRLGHKNRRHARRSAKA